MKQILLIVGAVFLITNISFSQILNGGFEDWESIQNFEKPINWETNQDSTTVRITKGTQSVEGEYSLRINPSDFFQWEPCNTYAFSETKLANEIGEAKSLFCHIKTIPEIANGSTFLSIFIRFYSGDAYLSEYQWLTFEEYNEFTQIEIPILNSNTDSLAILIEGGGLLLATDGCGALSTSWVDNMKIENSIMTSQVSDIKKELKVYPIPSRNVIEIQEGIIELESYSILNLIGEELESGLINNSRINLSSKGMLILVLITKSNEQIIKRIVNL